MQIGKETTRRGTIAAAWVLVCCTGLLSALAIADEPTAMEPEPRSQGSGSDIAIAASELPISLFFAYLAPIANLRLELQGDLPGTVTGKFEGSVQGIVDELATQHQFVWWLDSDTLHLAPSSEIQDVVQPWTGTSDSLQTLDDALSTNVYNTISASPAGLEVSGLAAFIGAVALQVADSTEPMAAPTEEPSSPGPLDGLDRIPGFQTF